MVLIIAKKRTTLHVAGILQLALSISYNLFLWLVTLYSVDSFQLYVVAIALCRLQ